MMILLSLIEAREAALEAATATEQVSAGAQTRLGRAVVSEAIVFLAISRVRSLQLFDEVLARIQKSIKLAQQGAQTPILGEIDLLDSIRELIIAADDADRALQIHLNEGMHQ